MREFSIDNEKLAKAMLPEWLSDIIDELNIDIVECGDAENCNDGDLFVSYLDREEAEEFYRDSILALDIENEAEESLYLDIDQKDSFKGQLLKRISKTKLWNYPPDAREDVKKARDFLSQFLEIDIPYGYSIAIPKDHAEEYFGDEKNRFGIKMCKYFVNKNQSIKTAPSEASLTEIKLHMSA